MWHSMTDSCEVSQCSIETENMFSPSLICSSYDNMEIDAFRDVFIGINEENQLLENPNKHNNDTLLYDNNYPSSSQPMEEFDQNSQDSGFGANLNDIEEKNILFESNIPCSNFSPSSLESTDDGFQEIAYIESDENTLLPPTFNSGVNEPIKIQTPVNTTRSRMRPSLRRNVSLKERSSLHFSGITKTPDCPNDCSPIQPKQYKNNDIIHRKIRRSCSANDASIMSALQQSFTNPDLIGDFSKPFCLPLVRGKHQDLKSISPTCLADLIQGKYDNTVDWFKVIDCRYPYEYNGGHILNAVNYYTKEQIMFELLENNIKNSKRNILVFHCEFSSKRGPSLYRFLRNVDRSRNSDSYPVLDWPEIYLLDGGYKNFYERYSGLCFPAAYKPMLDPAHEKDFKLFRTIAKNCNYDTRERFSVRSSSNLKKLNFV